MIPVRSATVAQPTTTTKRSVNDERVSIPAATRCRCHRTTIRFTSSAIGANVFIMDEIPEGPQVQAGRD